jgi:hypothetical protein
MTDDLDRILSGEDSLEPSAGFAAAVMTTVRGQAEAPPPAASPPQPARPSSPSSRPSPGPSLRLSRG